MGPLGDGACLGEHVVTCCHTAHVQPTFALLNSIGQFRWNLFLPMLCLHGNKMFTFIGFLWTPFQFDYERVKRETFLILEGLKHLVLGHFS